MATGKLSAKIVSKWNVILENELDNLKVALLNLKANEDFVLETDSCEYGFVLIQGDCNFEILNDLNGKMGPRKDPYTEKPYGLMVTKNRTVIFKAVEDTKIICGITPAEKEMKCSLISPESVGGGLRGQDNWSRTVNMVIWNDNTEGNALMMGETITPSGNWCTMPPHRHDNYIEGMEVPYNEAYFFQFSTPQGFGLGWEFDDEEMDEAYSLHTNDIMYMDKGYHPLCCAPGASMYQTTIMAGKYRMSHSNLHPDYKYLLGTEKNPYHNQNSKKI